MNDIACESSLSVDYNKDFWPFFLSIGHITEKY